MSPSSIVPRPPPRELILRRQYIRRVYIVTTVSPTPPPTVSTSSQSSIPPQTPAVFVAIPAVVVVTIGLAISVLLCIVVRRQRQQTDAYFLTSLSDGRRRRRQELRHRGQNSSQSELPTSRTQAPASSSVDEASRKRSELPITLAGTHTPSFRINSPPAVISAPSSSPLPEAETMVKQEERHDEDTQLKGEEPSTQPCLSPPPPAHVVSTRGNQPAPTEQIGCASCGTCDTAT